MINRLIHQDTVFTLYFHGGTGMYSSGMFFGKIAMCLSVIRMHGLGDADVRIGKDGIVMEGVDCLPELRKLDSVGSVMFSCVGSFSSAVVHDE